jgi:hypothetical protein
MPLFFLPSAFDKNEVKKSSSAVDEEDGLDDLESKQKSPHKSSFLSSSKRISKFSIKQHIKSYLHSKEN